MPLNTKPALAGDLERERDLSVARLLDEEFSNDPDLVAAIRRGIIEATRVEMAYGRYVSEHDYVMLTLEKLADSLRARHV